MSTVYLLRLEHTGDTLPPDKADLAAQVTAATGLTATAMAQGSDLELPYEETGRPPVMVEGGADDHALATWVTVRSLLIESPVVGYMPALSFAFDTDQPTPPILMAGDERYLRSMATLVTNAAASATHTATQHRRKHGQGPIPRLWNHGA